MYLMYVVGSILNADLMEENTFYPSNLRTNQPVEKLQENKSIRH